MAGYDPQKARGRHEIPDDEPAPVDGLLGPVPDDDATAAVLAHDAVRPTVRQVLPAPSPSAGAAPDAEPAPDPGPPAADAAPVADTAPGADDAEAAPESGATPEPGAADASAPAARPETIIDLDADPEPAVVVDEPRVAPTTGAVTPSPAPPTGSSRARIAAIVAVVVALVLLVVWRRRRR